MLSLGRLVRRPRARAEQPGVGRRAERQEPGQPPGRTWNGLARAWRRGTVTAAAAIVERLRDACPDTTARRCRSPLERVRARGGHQRVAGARHVTDVGPTSWLEAAVSIATLDELAATSTDGDDCRPRCATWPLTATSASWPRDRDAASRIHGLVTAVKGFTYMDQATIPKPVDVAQGLADTLTVLGAQGAGESRSRLRAGRRAGPAAHRRLRRRAEPGLVEPDRQCARRGARRRDTSRVAAARETGNPSSSA